MKKAGNLTHALGISTGDFIAVIDADFAVRPEFLYETMPYFDDAKVGIVQTAQYYDVSDRSFSYIQRYAGTLQEIFFRFIQPARDRHKAAICAGTNLVYRRAAVRAAGGFAQVPIGEDVHSGVKLWWAGFETRYLPLCLAKGVAPTDFPSLANQQARWCRSSMMLMTERHLHPGAVHLAAADRLLGRVPVLHVVGGAAAHRAVPDADDDLVLPRPRLPAQLSADPARARGEPVRVPGAEPRLAADHLPGLPHQLVLSPVLGLVRDPGTGGRVGADRRVARPGTGPGGGQPDPVHLDRRRAGTPLGGPGPEGAPVRLAPVLGDGDPGRHPALHGGAADDTGQGRLEAARSREGTA